MSLASLCVFSALVLPAGIFEGDLEIGFGADLNAGAHIYELPGPLNSDGSSSGSQLSSEAFYQGSLKLSLGLNKSPLALVAGLGFNNTPGVTNTGSLTGPRSIGTVAHLGLNYQLFAIDQKNAIYLNPRYEITFGDYRGSPSHEARLNAFWRVELFEFGLSGGLSWHQEPTESRTLAALYVGVFYEGILTFFGKEKKLDPAQRILDKPSWRPSDSGNL